MVGEGHSRTLTCPGAAGLGWLVVDASATLGGVLYEAIADDGPLEGAPNLTVERPDDRWPHFVIWADDGGRHEYRLKHPPEEHGLTASGSIPIYAYVRTLDGEQ